MDLTSSPYSTYINRIDSESSHVAKKQFNKVGQTVQIRHKAQTGNHADWSYFTHD